MTTDITERPARQQSKPEAEDIFEPHILAQYDPKVVKYIVDLAGAGIPAIRKCQAFDVTRSIR
jgi:hypothetical protein